jgi:hypothetical protein
MGADDSMMAAPTKAAAGILGFTFDTSPLQCAFAAQRITFGRNNVVDDDTS